MEANPIIAGEGRQVIIDDWLDINFAADATFANHFHGMDLTTGRQQYPSDGPQVHEIMTRGTSREVERNTTRTVTRIIYNPRPGENFLYEVIRNENNPEVVVIFSMSLTRRPLEFALQGAAGGIQFVEMERDGGENMPLPTPPSPVTEQVIRLQEHREEA